jgi:alpha-glucoside transport system permease protein
MTIARRRLGNALFILPAGLLLIVFMIYPIILTIRMSLDTGEGLKLSKFIGLTNFQNLFKDRLFIDLSNLSGAVFNNGLWLVLYVGGCLVLGLLIASLADRVRYERAIKAIVFAPQAIAATAAGIIWLLVYAPQSNIGLLNGALGAVGVQPVGLLGQSSTVNFAIIVAAVWAGTGLVVVILSAAIKGVPIELVEASMIDGASPFQTFRRIVMPMIAIPISVVVVTLAISVIKVFDIVYVMTHGGPAGSSRTIAYFYYVQTFEAGRGGYGAAAAVVMVLFMVPIMALNIRRFRLDDATR